MTLSIDATAVPFISKLKMTGMRITWRYTRRNSRAKCATNIAEGAVPWPNMCKNTNAAQKKYLSALNVVSTAIHVTCLVLTPDNIFSTTEFQVRHSHQQLRLIIMSDLIVDAYPVSNAIYAEGSCHPRLVSSRI